MAKTKRENRKTKKLKIRASIFGTETKPRLSVFRSNKHFEAQLIDDTKGVTLASITSKKIGLKVSSNKEAAAKVGKEMGAKIASLKIESIVFDRSGYIYHGRVAAFADAVREEGVKF
ncbi:MAG: 50S ribosomal protein L18 [Mollicutes bacterium PWAP]|nr:50S ribosomal protein L18 [Mollicutes bacterium PWAP]